MCPWVVLLRKDFIGEHDCGYGAGITGNHGISWRDFEELFFQACSKTVGGNGCESLAIFVILTLRHKVMFKILHGYFIYYIRMDYLFKLFPTDVKIIIGIGIVFR